MTIGDGMAWLAAALMVASVRYYGANASGREAGGVAHHPLASQPC